MDSCIFCRRSAPGKRALTVCNGDPEDVDSWRREIAPVCVCCNRLIGEAGREGRVLKATGERWYGGHGVGRFRAAGQREYPDDDEGTK
jgi:hypothetical protein